MVELYALECGQLTMATGTFLEGEEGMMKVPVPAFLVRHPKGSLLFDSGLHDRSKSEPLDYFGPELAPLVTVHRTADEEISAALAALDVDPSEVKMLVNSHLHFDHCGGNVKLGDATVVVQRREWECATRDAPFGYCTGDYVTGQEVRQIEGELDLFGDGSVVCIPTYGHTPGHQSLRVRTERGEFVLTGDACYLRRTLEQLHLPGVLHDREQALASLRALRELQTRGATIVYGHDPDFWATLRRAPERLG